MTALKTPDPDAPAAAWGQLAERIPGWRSPDPSLLLCGVRPCMPRIAVGSPIGDSPSPRYVIDPDHWAWQGWLWQLAGRPEVMVERGGERVRIWDGSPEAIQQQLSGTGTTKGRALISYAAAAGRWPGGGG